MGVSNWPIFELTVPVETAAKISMSATLALKRWS